MSDCSIPKPSDDIPKCQASESSESTVTMHTDWFVFSTSESSGVGRQGGDCGGESSPILDVVARTHHNLIGVDDFLPSPVVILALKTMPKDAAPDVMPDLRMCRLFDTSGKVC